ncbi:uncharacterized protein SPPG_01489 [Spizellomyces punctatus DAOM BR117]|uniref:Uncharacterized protein n=1 Tax=Spizellomyces punctatus (strain DAOM BR117) TaxID=645134 RepID=A0A0L0HSE1_SPIPD|nr:uncharacterized protein SPPG_01489 [Spizellomyces punctatus DAOM BR117]KND04043.1 hypothetical protein SPPG_01489 [Spizellomyces punctatus DAOM BR117]|eukprot:XP_016612082.1 hypothetical protein SPPG_01489 [Spizellomyces punctatus DAOM BR117]
MAAKKGGRKGIGKKPKKNTPVIPPVFDYSTYIQPKWTPKHLEPEAFAGAAAQMRSDMHERLENDTVTLRIRQVDWEYHDAFVMVEKGCTIMRLMRDMIAEQIHGGAVDADDVMVYLGKETERSADETTEDTGLGREDGSRMSLKIERDDAGWDRELESSTWSISAARQAVNDKSSHITKTSETRPGRRADPLTRLENCFPEVMNFPSRGRSVSPPRPPLATLPADDPNLIETPNGAKGATASKTDILPLGRVVFTNDLQARLQEIAQAQAEMARQLQLAAAGMANIPARRATFVQGLGMLSSTTGGPLSRRGSFMVPPPVPLSRATSGVLDMSGLPPPLAPTQVQLPQAVTIWYDIGSHTAPRVAPTASLSREIANISTCAGKKRASSASASRASSARNRDNDASKSPALSKVTSSVFLAPLPAAPSFRQTHPSQPFHRFDRSDPIVMYEGFKFRRKSVPGPNVSLRPPSASSGRGLGRGTIGLSRSRSAMVASGASALNLYRAAAGRRRDNGRQETPPTHDSGGLGEGDENSIYESAEMDAASKRRTKPSGLATFNEDSQTAKP